MQFSRREFLGTAVAGLAGWPLVSRMSGQVAGAEMEPYPLRKLIERFPEDQQAAMSSFSPTGLRREDYLPVMAGIVRFFAPLQDGRGAIIDPYEHEEKQYATPAFALACAVLLQAGWNAELLEPCMRAMDRACADIEVGKAANGHNDFYTGLLMQAWRTLAGMAPEARRAVWTRHLAGIVPGKIYHGQPTAAHINNWNLVAADGEWLRRQFLLEPLGMLKGTAGDDNLGWIEASLDRQMANFTPEGMYRDPHDPLAYDHFARVHVVEMLFNGYRGRHAAQLQALMERGALTTLLLQSPAGELPCGGRSAHHQWNEAIQAITCETYARHFMAGGDVAMAGAFKRAARLSLLSIQRWIRPTGELWIVKNRFDPKLRWGYESYSFHSQYNLLTAAKLGLAWQAADDSIAERPCPAEVGGFAIVLQPAFHKVFANAGGCYLELDTAADAGYNPTGLLRVHRTGVDPQLTISDGAAQLRVYDTPQPPARSLAIGPAWLAADGKWYSLAEHAAPVGSVSAARLGDLGGLQAAEVKVQVEGVGRISVDVHYQGRFLGGATGVRQHLVLTPREVEVHDAVEGAVRAVRTQMPILRTDGERTAQVVLTGNHLETSLGRSRMGWQGLTAGMRSRREEWRLPFRNGEMDAVVSDCPGREGRYRIGAGE